jgi:hypothetical protein
MYERDEGKEGRGEGFRYERNYFAVFFASNITMLLHRPQCMRMYIHKRIIL